MLDKTEYKQVIVLRKDLNMRKGKMVAQGAHASMKATLENIDHPSVKAWLQGAFTKIAVSVTSEEELMQVYENAREKGLVCSLILDAGRTEFKEPTYTAVGVGPAKRKDVDEVTGHLKLL